MLQAADSKTALTSGLSKNMSPNETCCFPPFGLLSQRRAAGEGQVGHSSRSKMKDRRPEGLKLGWSEMTADPSKTATARTGNTGSPMNSPGSPLSSPGSPKTPKRKMAHVFLQKPKAGNVAVVGAPLCEGQPLGGVDLAPNAFRQGGLQAVIENEGWTFKDTGDVPRPESDPDLPRALASQTPGVDDRNQFFDSKLVMNSKVVGHSVGRVYEQVSAAKEDGSFVLTLGGDHSIAAGSIAGVMKHRPELAVIWIDAHGDCNVPDSSPSANYHGMPLAHLLGWFDHKVDGFQWLEEHMERFGDLPEDRVALIGLRDVDPAEAQMLKDSGVHVYTMREVDKHGIGAVMDSALRRVDPNGERPLHLSFDIDACDPTVAPGTGTCSRGGLSYRESHYICDRLAETCRLGSMDIVEVNPALDVASDEKMHGDDPLISGSQTVRLGIELVATALGKKLV